MIQSDQTLNPATVYNSGIIYVYRRKEEKLTVNKNVKTLADLDFIVKLAYKELSKRQQDIEFAEANSFSLSLKVKTQRPRGTDLDSTCLAVIEGMLYGVAYIDTTGREYYFYLEKIRELEEAEDE